VEGSILGTPAYMAPERFSNKLYDGRSDVYSLGVTLYQMLEGRLPFVATGDPMSLAMMHLNDPPPRLTGGPGHTPGLLQALIERTLAKRPEARPTAAEFASLLAQTVAALGEAARSRHMAVGAPEVSGSAEPQALTLDAAQAALAGSAPTLEDSAALAAAETREAAAALTGATETLDAGAPTAHTQKAVPPLPQAAGADKSETG
jgi:serine/threonine-protein kinase